MGQPPTDAVRPKPLFGLKDIFTSLNALSGAVAIILCIEGKPFYAGCSILLGWAADAFDGLVARATGTANRFGGEYDTISDHLAHIIAPAAVVYTVYKNADFGLPTPWSWWIAVALASAIMITGSVRHARNVVRPVLGFKGIWCGLPRTMVGFLAIGYANSVFLHQWGVAGSWIGVGIGAASCFATLTHWPFLSHHVARRLGTFTRVMVTLTFATTFGALFFYRGYVFDILLFWSCGYSLFCWNALTKEERTRWAQLVHEAKLRGELPE
jgi:phosphatidylserine synthase